MNSFTESLTASGKFVNPPKPDFNFLAGHKDAGQRLDLFLKSYLKKFSRNQIQKWIKSGAVLCNGKNALPSYVLKSGDTITASIPKEEISILPEKLPLEILYEDEVLLVVNKPAGMVTHPAKGNFRGTLANAVAYHISLHNLSAQNLRPGIVHRLDKGTSGVLVVAKNSFTLNSLAEQFRLRKVRKVYRAIVYGRMPYAKGEIEASIGSDPRRKKMAVMSSGRPSRTTFKIIKRFPFHSVLEIYPETGRTHQIRVHLAKIGYPILGDALYGKKTETFSRLERGSRSFAPRRTPLSTHPMLHAYKISIRHPTFGKTMTFSAPLPEDFIRALKDVQGDRYTASK